MQCPCVYFIREVPSAPGRILQVCRLLPDDWQVPLLLHAHHCFIQAFLQRSELQAQVLEPLVGELVRLRHRLAVVLTPSVHPDTTGFPESATHRHNTYIGEGNRSRGVRHGANIMNDSLGRDGVLREELPEHGDELSAMQHGADAEVAAAGAGALVR